MRISDWSSDVCSSDLAGILGAVPPFSALVVYMAAATTADAAKDAPSEIRVRMRFMSATNQLKSTNLLNGISRKRLPVAAKMAFASAGAAAATEIGRASCRERVGLYG